MSPVAVNTEPICYNAEVSAPLQTSLAVLLKINTVIGYIFHEGTLRKVKCDRKTKWTVAVINIQTTGKNIIYGHFLLECKLNDIGSTIKYCDVFLQMEPAVCDPPYHHVQVRKNPSVFTLVLGFNPQCHKCWGVKLYYHFYSHTYCHTVYIDLCAVVLLICFYLLTEYFLGVFSVSLSVFLRDVPLSPEELQFLIEKVLRMFLKLDLQEIPPLIYQLLLLSAKVCWSHMPASHITQSHYV